MLNPMQIIDWITLSLGIVLGFYALALGLTYLGAAQAGAVLQKHARRLKSLRHLDELDSSAYPPLTLVLPLSFLPASLLPEWLNLDYPDTECVLVFDAADPQALLQLREQYDFRPVPRFPVADLLTAKIKGVYRSSSQPQLWLLDKEPGILPDAFNAGLNFCQSPLVALVSGNIRPERNALLQVARQFLENTQIWAVCGRIRSSDNWQQGPYPSLPQHFWGKLHILIEQREQFLSDLRQSQRQFFAHLSPQLTLFRRAPLVDAGGINGYHNTYMVDTVVALQRVAEQRMQQMSLRYLPDTLGWKPVAENAEQLRAEIAELQCLRRQLQLKTPPRHGNRYRRWRGFYAPLLTLLAGVAALGLCGVQPLALAGLPFLLLSPAAIWMRCLWLGEMVSRRYTREDLQQLLRLALWFPLWGEFWLAWVYLRSWRTQPQKLASPAAPARTSPLKQTARLDLQL